MSEPRYLIVGNSVAAVHCIEAIRAAGREGPITVVSDEELVNYSRPLLSYWLGGRISEDRLAFRSPAFYREHGVELILGRRVEGLELPERRVRLAGGQRLRYDRLLLAVGGVPILPPIEGLDEVREGAFTFLRWSDARALVDYIEARSLREAVVLGGGLIGLKAVEGLLERGLRVTVVELADRLLASTLDREASGLLEEHLLEHGCRVIKGDTVRRVEASGGVLSGVVLRSGQRLSTRLLIIAVGVRPNRALVEGTPIQADRGILVDPFMRTTVEGVYAAGDCAQALDFLTKSRAVIAIWPVAARQGRVAGLNMAGRPTQYPGLFAMNSVQILRIPTISFGITNPPPGEGYEVLSVLDRQRPLYRKVVLREGRVVGVILLGRIERAGVYGMLIREGLDVSHCKEQLLGEDFGLLVLPREFRRHLVGEGMEV